MKSWLNYTIKNQKQNKTKKKSNKCCLYEKPFYICEPINHKKIEIMKTTINFYEGSYLFESITTEFNVTTDFIEMKLAKQYEYRPTNEDLWAIVLNDSMEIARYEFFYGQGLNQIKFK